MASSARSGSISREGSAYKFELDSDSISYYPMVDLSLMWDGRSRVRSRFDRDGAVYGAVYGPGGDLI